MTEAKVAGQGSLLIITIVVLVDMIGFGIIIPFLTFMVAHLSGPDAEIGFWVATLMSGYAAAVFLFSSFWGSLSDRYGRRPILMIGLLGNTGTFILFGLSTTLWMAFVARVLSGIFNANIPVARAYISDVSKPHEVAKRQGLLGVAFGVGFTIGPALGVQFFKIQYSIQIPIFSLVSLHRFFQVSPFYYRYGGYQRAYR
jgi:DHA1 family tetracycline resistance protein-like MFS transporter